MRRWNIMKPLKDYVEIIFAVLALAGLVFVFWYFLVAVPAKKAEKSGTFVMVPGTEMEVCRGTVTGVLKTIGDMDRKPWSA
jgi:hypothetical protein